MALATRCPNCNALFRVGAEQLRSRGGMVRCGSCRKVFNAIAGLDYLDAERLAADDAATPAAPLTAPAGSPATAPGPSAGKSAAATSTPGPLPVRSTAGNAERAPSGTGQVVGDPSTPAPTPAVKSAATPAVTRPAMPAMTPATKPATPAPVLVAAAQPKAGAAPAAFAPRSKPSAPAPGDRRRNPRAASGTLSEVLATGIGAAAPDFRIAEPARGPASEQPAAAFDTLFIVPRDESDGESGFGDRFQRDDTPAAAAFDTAPSFLKESAPSALVRGLLIAGSVLLLPLLVAQLALIFRTPLVVAFPAMRPALQQLCAPLSCTASWPMRPDLLAVVSSELQAVPGTSVLELDTVLRNRAAFPLALPAIELTISDNNGRTAVRKVFLPGEYLRSAPEAGADAATGNIAAGADLPVRVFFDLPGIGATNFEAYPFYP